MTALFEDWDLGGDDEHLKILLNDAMYEATVSRTEVQYIDEHAGMYRGRPLGNAFHDKAPVARARLRHAERQVCRIREAINNLESDRAAAERRNKGKAGVTLKVPSRRK